MILPALISSITWSWMAGLAHSGALTCTAMVSGYAGGVGVSVTVTVEDVTRAWSSVAWSSIDATPWGMYTRNWPPGSISTGMPLAVSDWAPSTMPRRVAT